MSAEDAKDIAAEAIDQGAEKAKEATKFIPLITNLGSGMLSLTVAAVSGKMALERFKLAYEASKKTSS